MWDWLGWLRISDLFNFLKCRFVELVRLCLVFSFGYFGLELLGFLQEAIGNTLNVDLLLILKLNYISTCVALFRWVWLIGKCTTTHIGLCLYVCV